MSFKLHSDTYPKGEKIIRRQVNEAADVIKIKELLADTNIQEEEFTNEYYRKRVKEATLIDINKKIKNK